MVNWEDGVKISDAYVNEDGTITPAVYEGKTPVSAYNLNKMQNDLKQEGIIVSPTEPTTGEKVWIQKGKNLFDGALTMGFYNNTGEAEISIDTFRNVNNVPVGPNTTYVFSKDGVYMNMCVYFYDINKTYISAVGTKDSGQSGLGYFTTPDNCYYINFRCYGADYVSDFENLNIQLEEGKIVTEHEQYIEPKIYVKNDNGVYEEFIQKKEETYSTEEQKIGTWIDGKPLYRKTISCGALPNATTKSVSVGVSDIWQVTHLHGFAFNSAGATMPIPYTHISDVTQQVTTSYSGGSSGVVYIATGTDRSSFSGYMTIEYTKTTD